MEGAANMQIPINRKGTRIIPGERHSPLPTGISCTSSSANAATEHNKNNKLNSFFISLRIIIFCKSNESIANNQIKSKNCVFYIPKK